MITLLMARNCVLIYIGVSGGNALGAWHVAKTSLRFAQVLIHSSQGLMRERKEHPCCSDTLPKFDQDADRGRGWEEQVMPTPSFPRVVST